MISSHEHILESFRYWHLSEQKYRCLLFANNLAVRASYNGSSGIYVYVHSQQRSVSEPNSWTQIVDPLSLT